VAQGVWLAQMLLPLLLLLRQQVQQQHWMQ
jgi:hypothetical protein